MTGGEKKREEKNKEKEKEKSANIWTEAKVTKLIACVCAEPNKYMLRFWPNGPLLQQCLPPPLPPPLGQGLDPKWLNPDSDPAFLVNQSPHPGSILNFFYFSSFQVF